MRQNMTINWLFQNNSCKFILNKHNLYIVQSLFLVKVTYKTQLITFIMQLCMLQQVAKIISMLGVGTFRDGNHHQKYQRGGWVIWANFEKYLWHFSKKIPSKMYLNCQKRKIFFRIFDKFQKKNLNIFQKIQYVLDHILGGWGHSNQIFLTKSTFKSPEKYFELRG